MNPFQPHLKLWACHYCLKILYRFPNNPVNMEWINDRNFKRGERGDGEGGCSMPSHSSEANSDPVLLDVHSQSSSAPWNSSKRPTTPLVQVVVFSVLWFLFSELGWMSIACLPLRVWEGSTTGPGLDASWSIIISKFPIVGRHQQAWEWSSQPSGQ